MEGEVCVKSNKFVPAPMGRLMFQNSSPFTFQLVCVCVYACVCVSVCVCVFGGYKETKNKIKIRVR